jgi:hypothetical protein
LLRAVDDVLEEETGGRDDADVVDGEDRSAGLAAKSEGDDWFFMG